MVKLDTEAIDRLTPLQRAALAVEKIQSELADARRMQKEPIAIVGAACRFPVDANDLSDFARLLYSGSDSIGEVPPGRWPAKANCDSHAGVSPEMYVSQGAFLQEVGAFDAEFFRILPREAMEMDPQQSL